MSIACLLVKTYLVTVTQVLKMLISEGEMINEWNKKWENMRDPALNTS